MKELEKLEKNVKDAICQGRGITHFEILVQLEIAKQLNYIMYELNELRKIIMDK
jgi:hypothetical protein